MYPDDSFNRTKKIIIWGVIVIVTIVVIIGIFVMIKKQPGETTGNTVKNLFPFGTNTPRVPVVPGNPDTNTTNTEPNNASVDLEIASRAKIRKITNFPVSGYQTYQTILTQTISEYNANLKKQVVRQIMTPIEHIIYAKTDNGFIYDGVVSPDTVIQQQKTNTEIPGVYESTIMISPLRIMYRYALNDVIQTFAAPVPVKTVIPAKPTVTGTVPAEFCTVEFTRNLTKGTKGVDVLTIQVIMNQKLGTRVKTDGVFGTNTAANTKKLQAFLNVAATGNYDDATRAALNALCAELLAPTPAPAAVASNDEPQPITGKLLDKNILAQSLIYRFRNQSFSLVRTNSGVRGFTTDDRGATRDIFTSPFTEWKPLWVNDRLITMTTRSSGLIDGYMYGLNPTTANFIKMIGPIRGLTTLTSPDGTKTLFSQSDNTTISTWVRTMTTGVNSRMKLDTLPEKCTWNTLSNIVYCMIPENIPVGNYPDDWYQGTIQFNDTLWQMNLVTNEITQIGLFPESVDGYRLELSKNEQFLYLMNKRDGSLWAVTL